MGHAAQALHFPILFRSMFCAHFWFVSLLFSYLLIEIKIRFILTDH